MNSIRKWLYKPKKTDQSLLAQFFYADEDLNTVAAELDSFDGRKDPDRCTALVNHLRQCQDKVLNICQMIMDEVIPEDRAARDFRAKFPDDVLQENLAGQLWFGAECLAAGSNILNRELESASMRPLAKALTKSLENVRNLLREQCFRNPPEFTEKICESLKILDRLFAEFELSYVSAMVPVKTVYEYEAQQAITVLFSETLQRALKLGLLSQEQVDSCDPGLMFTIPRLAIVSGLLIFPDGPLCLDHGDLSDMFRPFRSLLLKIRELLWTLNRSELGALERALCSVEETFIEPSELVDTEPADTIPNNKNKLTSSQPNSTATRNHHNSSSHHSHSHRHFHHHHHHHQPHGELIPTLSPDGDPIPIAAHAIQDYLDQFFKDFPQCKDFITDLCHNSSTPTTTSLDQDDATLAIDSDSAEPNLTDNNNDEEIESFSNSTHSLQYSSLTSQESDGLTVNNNEQNSGAVQTSSTDEELLATALEAANLADSATSSNSLPSSPTIKHVTNPTPVCGLDKTETEKLLQTDVVMTWVAAPEEEYDNIEMVDEIRIHETECLKSCDENRGEVEQMNPTPSNSTRCSSLSLKEDDLSTPVEEMRADGGSVLVESFETSSCCNSSGSKSSSHSSSSSRDSGLSSMADTETPTAISKSLSPETEKVEESSGSGSSFSFSRTSQEKGKPDLVLQFELGNLQDCRSSEVPEPNSASGCQVMTVVMNANRLRPPINPISCQEISSCSGSCCNSDCSASIGGESTCETSSFDSECQDDMEIALAMQAAEIASRNEVRARFKSSSDLIHRLFICISGVADQLQTNYAADLRSTLKCVFAMNATPSDCEDETGSLDDGGSCGDNSGLDVTPEPSLDEEDHMQSGDVDNFLNSSSHGPNNIHRRSGGHSSVETISPPTWVPDELAPQCMACSAAFTVVRRRHHCRNCGKVFCGKCSGNSVPLPRYGHLKPVRVCNCCFLYSVTPFTLPTSSES